MLEAKKNFLRDSLLTPFIRLTNIDNCPIWANKTEVPCPRACAYQWEFMSMPSQVKKLLRALRGFGGRAGGSLGLWHLEQGSPFCCACVHFGAHFGGSSLLGK